MIVQVTNCLTRGFTTPRWRSNDIEWLMSSWLGWDTLINGHVKVYIYICVCEGYTLGSYAGFQKWGSSKTTQLTGIIPYKPIDFKVPPFQRYWLDRFMAHHIWKPFLETHIYIYDITYVNEKRYIHVLHMLDGLYIMAHPCTSIYTCIYRSIHTFNYTSICIHIYQL